MMLTRYKWPSVIRSRQSNSQFRYRFASIISILQQNPYRIEVPSTFTFNSPPEARVDSDMAEADWRLTTCLGIPSYNAADSCIDIERMVHPTEQCIPKGQYAYT